MLFSISREKAKEIRKKMVSCLYGPVYVPLSTYFSITDQIYSSDNPHKKVFLSEEEVKQISCFFPEIYNYLERAK